MSAIRFDIAQEKLRDIARGFCVWPFEAAQGVTKIDSSRRAE